jgi:hypothetical protein
MTDTTVQSHAALASIAPAATNDVAPCPTARLQLDHVTPRARQDRPTLDLDRWAAHFASNRLDRPEPDWAAPLAVPAHAHAALTQSMREFQLGDGGGPACLIAHDAASYTHQTEALKTVIDAWFLEEKQHARLLGGVVDRLGGERLASHWSFRLFCAVRWLMGVRFELQILTVTELTSTAYYTLVRRHYHDPALNQALSLILRDEAGHLAFHLDRLTATLAAKPRWQRALHRWQFHLSGLAAASVLWASHHRCPCAVGATHGDFFHEANRQIGRFLMRLERRCR